MRSALALRVIAMSFTKGFGIDRAQTSPHHPLRGFSAVLIAVWSALLPTVAKDETR